MVLGILKIALRLRDRLVFYVTITGSFECFLYFNFEAIFLENENLFRETRVENATFPRLKMQHFHVKVPIQKPLLIRIG